MTIFLLLLMKLWTFLGKKKGRKGSFEALKIDMKKAYDKVRRNFLGAVLTAMNFNQQQINWMMECVTSVQYTLPVNGSRSKSFKPCKGLRQDDPLSPYLFLMCANVLSLSLQKAEHDKLINGIKAGKSGCTFYICCLLMTLCFFFKKTTNQQQL